MTPNQMQDRASAMMDLYARAEEIMLKKVAGRITRGFRANNVDGWAEKKYREVDQMRRELAAELRSLNAQSAQMREAMLNEAYETGRESFEQELLSLGRVQQVIPNSRFNAVSSLVGEMDQRFDAMHSEILRTTEDEYRHIIGNVVSLQATGVTTTQQSIKKALEDFADKGITSFTDKAGRRWNMDTYAEMAVRTSMMRAAVQGYTDDALDHDEHLVIVSDHQDTCPLCEKWERMVLALDELGRRQPDCEGTLDEAEAAGLFHPNCLHSVTVYVPGLTIKAGSKARQGYTRQMNAAGYANRQNQRYMERMVRQWKRRQAVATTPEDERLAKAYVDRWQHKLRELVDDTDLPRQYRREGGRQKLSEAAKKLKPLQFASDGSIIYTADYTSWLRAGYEKAVREGDVSTLTGFEHYQNVARQVEKELVGIETSDGIRIAGYKTHFIDRIIGSPEKKREPVDIQNAKDALMYSSNITKRRPKDRSKNSNTYNTDDCKVTINPDTGLLIQATPRRKADE